MKILPIRPTKCATCPWRDNSPHRELREMLSESALTKSRICHSTGRSVIYGRTGKPQAICRGARDEQLARFAGLGFISAPTDAAWAAKVAEMR